MTYRKLAPWMDEDDFTLMPLRERIAYVRKNLGPRKPGTKRRKPHLTLDEFAALVGATGRHRVIGWEKKGEIPGDSYAEAIAKLTPYPTAALGGPGAAALFEEKVGLRLRSLQAEVGWLKGWLSRGFAALGVPPELRGEEPQAQADGDSL